tara:strand:- start:370 stop:1050 length:681 start_codon:yes stop_codon:yes gene_type:complete
MANEYKIEINKREDLTSQGLKKLRNTGYIPGIYYSATSNKSTPIVVSEKDFNEALKSGARIFNISVAGKKQNVLFKSIQYHPVTDEVLHLDLFGISMDKPINIGVPIQLIGTAPGVREGGGVLNQPLNEVEIQCLPAEIPNFIELDISELQLGHSLNAGDIKLDKKYTLSTNEDDVIVSITQPMKEVEVETETEEGDEFMDEDATSSDEAKDAVDGSDDPGEESTS